ncbi:MAG: NAD(P)-dependent oxidoreductase [Solobacterium sp.]|nr:NAD(P)-dependent oxidoreductase [Solobacterium sp.]
MEKTKRIKMDVVDAAIRKHNFYPFIANYTEEEVKEEAARCLNCPKPLCREGCPIHNRIPDFMQKVKEGDYKAAFQLIDGRSCFPDICGTVCPHEKQCEGNCIRNRIDEPLAIGAIERFIAEWATNNGLTKKKKVKSTGKKVACVGGGPASMACAMRLAEAGVDVTIYDMNSALGGVMNWGIPSYRLPREMIVEHIRQLKELGVTFVPRIKVGKDINLATLQKENDAVFLGIGARLANDMHVEGEDLDGVFKADRFLTAINMAEMDEEGRRHFPLCGKHVLVCGGGNVAMDAARSAIRLKQVEKVTVIYRRSEEEMPACSEERNHALEEGIEFLTLHNPVAFIGKDGRVAQAECVKMKLGEVDQSGRRRPIETNDPHIFLDVDTVVLALGFNNDPLLSTKEKDLVVNKHGYYVVNEDGKTSMDHVYAGGDDTLGPDTVVRAMRAGLNSAKAILKEMGL